MKCDKCDKAITVFFGQGWDLGEIARGLGVPVTDMSQPEKGFVLCGRNTVVTKCGCGYGKMEIK